MPLICKLNLDGVSLFGQVNAKFHFCFHLEFDHSISLMKQVHKQGVAVGRSVDLTKFEGYNELIAVLDHIFEFNGELIAPNKKWLVTFTDNEGDMMLVGDDPWQ